MINRTEFPRPMAPGTIGALQVKNTTVMASMGTRLAVSNYFAETFKKLNDAFILALNA